MRNKVNAFSPFFLIAPIYIGFNIVASVPIDDTIPVPIPLIRAG
jgi:hypothetical protein